MKHGVDLHHPVEIRAFNNLRSLHQMTLERIQFLIGDALRRQRRRQPFRGAPDLKDLNQILREIPAT